MKKETQKLTREMITGAAFAVLVLISSCSFHSNQWDAVKRLMRPHEAVIQDRWFLSGPVENVRVYPVEIGDAIIFTDGGDILLNFDGWHFTEIRGLSQAFSESISDLQRTTVFRYIATETAKSDSKKEKLFAKRSISFGDRNRIVYQVNCKVWKQVPVIAGKLLSQSCSFDSQEAFSNSIWLDQSGNIRVVESVLGPGGDKFRVEMRDP